ncbi:hypothetical protein PC117_g11338 [Phytophthora cactorum]|uniref:Uncharacterized protein n=1 Tax=Phytophthora cactorum TaxID=29920 RepID=A0A8T1DBN4_9STRA|nr:hypothetical protein PC117_g11338 [Phytophthora cactorum]
MQTCATAVALACGLLMPHDALALFAKELSSSM